MTARACIIGMAVAIAATSMAFAQDPNEPAVYDPVIYDYEIVETYPHKTNAFSQGLFFKDGDLFESTGQFGQSSLRRVDLTSGAVLQRTEMPARDFGEGSTFVGEDIFVLTWRNGVAYRYDADDFSLEKTFTYDGEGWGLTYNGDALIMSDGTAQLRFFNPETFTEKRRITVTYKGKPLSKLNELEWIDGEIFANVWQTNFIVRIDETSGVVTGIIDLRGLLPSEDFVQGETDVLNGIAYNDGRLYVTGKNWPKLFEINLVARETP